MLYVASATIKEDQLTNYRQWLVDSRGQIDASWPDGWTLKDVCFTTYGLGGYRTEIFWEIGGYAAFDDLASVQDTTTTSLMRDWFDFLDLSTLQGRVLKSAFGSEATLRAR